MFMTKGVIYTQWVMISISLVLVAVLALQNYQLKGQVSEAASSDWRSLERYAFHEALYKRLLNKTFPIDLHADNLHFADTTRLNSSRKLLLAVFDFTTCGHCLLEELELLRSLMKRIESKNISVIGVIGIVNEREKYATLKLRREGKLQFPYTFADHEGLREIIALGPGAYTDTPVYFVVDEAFTIRDIFKPDATDITQLESWIESTLIN